MLRLQRMFTSNNKGLDEYQIFCKKIAKVELVHDLDESNYGIGDSRTLKSQDHGLKKQVIEFFNKPNLIIKSPYLQNINELMKHPFIVGESHDNIEPKKFLMENMQELKKSGYEILFMEHLFYDNQHDLDLFHQSGKWPERLKQRLTDIDAMFKLTSEKYNFSALVEMAQKAGIRVVALDSEAVYKTQDINTGHIADNRVPNMNYMAYHIITREKAKLSKGKKWCGLTGAFHLVHYKKVIRVNDIDTPGINQLTGARLVRVGSLNTEKKLSEQKQVSLLSDVATNVIIKIEGSPSETIADLYIRRHHELPFDFKSLAENCKENKEYCLKLPAEEFYQRAIQAKYAGEEKGYEENLIRAATEIDYVVNPKAQHELALFYQSKKDEVKSKKWMELAIKSGYKADEHSNKEMRIAVQI